MWARAPGYSQLMWSRKTDVIGSCDLCYRAATDREAFAHTESEKLMQTVDQINRRFPKGIAIAAAGFDQDWRPKAERISKRYTTDWQELVVVKAN